MTTLMCMLVLVTCFSGTIGAQEPTPAGSSAATTAKAEEKKKYVDGKTKEYKESSASLKKEWEAEKEKYKDKFGSALKEIEAYIAELEGALDYGDAELRRIIKSDLADLKRIQNDFQTIHSELAAATAVKWMHIKNNIDKALENLKQEIKNLVPAGQE